MSDTKEWLSCTTDEERIARILDRASVFKEYIDSDEIDPTPAFEFGNYAADEYIPWLMERLSEVEAERDGLKAEMLRIVTVYSEGIYAGQTSSEMYDIAKKFVPTSPNA